MNTNLDEVTAQLTAFIPDTILLPLRMWVPDVFTVEPGSVAIIRGADDGKLRLLCHLPDGTPERGSGDGLFFTFGRTIRRSELPSRLRPWDEQTPQEAFVLASGLTLEQCFTIIGVDD